MIAALGTFSATLIIATTMAVSTVSASTFANARQSTSFAVETSLPVPQLGLPSSDTFFDNCASSARYYARIDQTQIDAASRLHWTSKNYSLSESDLSRFVYIPSLSLERTSETAAFDTWHSSFSLKWSNTAKLVSNTRELRSLIPEADPTLLLDAASFYENVKALPWSPNIWSDDAEVTFEWIGAGKHAVVTFDGENRYGYAMLLDGRFRAGAVEVQNAGEFPDDLKRYLETA